ncbi:hypothetical protein DSCOOX_05340 [Desulfosarcina ovata subsp. ovata]|uniref:Uncharacterized protein n=1 Tax=Desulfosarcina ovata subsp. ovata TaxID=2752305 RepID=A0A5K8A4T4_9BACT|nr:hypothetical protein DSCOOX_05340 [Desulfosarcina ovata subsp. ovata]
MTLGVVGKRSLAKNIITYPLPGLNAITNTNFYSGICDRMVSFTDRTGSTGFTLTATPAGDILNMIPEKGG